MFPRLILLMAASLANLDAASQLPMKVAMGPATSSLFDSPAVTTDSHAERIGVAKPTPSRMLRYAKPRRPAPRPFGPRRARPPMFTQVPETPDLAIPRAPGAARLPHPTIVTAGPPAVGRHPKIRIVTRPLWLRYGP